MLPVSAAVVGAGAIGAGFDDPDTRLPLTHAGGYRASTGCLMVVCPEKALKLR